MHDATPASPPRARGAPAPRRAASRPAVGDLGPLDERDAVGGRVVGEQRRVLAVEVAEPVQVEVGDGDGAVVAAPDRERRARHRAGDPERAAGAAHERRLAGAHLAGDEHDVAGPQPPASAAPSASVSSGEAVSVGLEVGIGGAAAAAPAARVALAPLVAQGAEPLPAAVYDRHRGRGRRRRRR